MPSRQMQVYSRIFWHIQTDQAGIFTSTFRTLCNLGIFRTQVYSEPETYSEPWYIQNPGIFRTVVYSQPWYIQNPVKHLGWRVFSKIVHGYNYFHKISFSSSLLYEKKIIFLIKVSLVSHKYLFDVEQLITVLVYGSSSPKSQSYLNLNL